MAVERENKLVIDKEKKYKREGERERNYCFSKHFSYGMSQMWISRYMDFNKEFKRLPISSLPRHILR